MTLFTFLFTASKQGPVVKTNDVVSERFVKNLNAFHNMPIFLLKKKLYLFFHQKCQCIRL